MAVVRVYGSAVLSSSASKGHPVRVYVSLEGVSPGNHPREAPEGKLRGWFSGPEGAIIVGAPQCGPRLLMRSPQSHGFEPNWVN